MTVEMAVKTVNEMSYSSSLLQTQQLILTIFSSVGYLRDLFPENSFTDNFIVGMKLKKFKKSVDTNTDIFLEW